ncbi:MAG: helix-turn-helix domain-containing protein [Phycisphaerae bacterium]|nr:helix-turn-helix domain-containing protein [Phycisphaerae bacterium]
MDAFDACVPFVGHRGEVELDMSSFPTHSHDFVELVLVEGGRGMHIAGDDRHELTAGDVFVVQGEMAHGFEDIHSLRLVNVMYAHSLLASAEGMLRRIPGYHALFVLEPQCRRSRGFTCRLRLGQGGLEHASDLCRRMSEEFAARRCGYEAFIASTLLELAVFVSREYGQIESAPARSLVRIGEVISHLQTHYAEPISLEDLAELACVSKNTLLRRFREGTGESPIRYLLGVRVDRARQLLRRTDCSVTEVAFRVGFADSNYFSRRFRDLTGCSPREFRQQNA